MNSYELAVNNIARYGDTDIFPFPIENSLFYDKSNEICDLLKKIETSFEDYIRNYPVEKCSTCIPVGTTGFRWATQIDPIWNAYLLHLVITISEQIEKKRIDVARKSVFSYRFSPNSASGKLFSDQVNWRSFIETSIEVAESKDYSYVVRSDISDFYTRIYHHRLENALKRTGAENSTINKIRRILQDIAGNNSYGLPVGGNAARILAETLLTSVDDFMVSKRMRFCRFVDDFVIYCASKEEAFGFLNLIADFLLRNEGLSLQKNKTQVCTCSEYSNQAKNLLLGIDEGEQTKKRAEFLNLHIFYDPYSPTAEDDYAELKKNLDRFDINGLLKEEIRKSRIHKALGRQLLNALSMLEGEKLGIAFQAISSNFEVFYPIFPAVLRLACKALEFAPDAYQDDFVQSICKLVDNHSYLVQNENTLSYLVRALSKSKLEIAEQTIDRIYNESKISDMVRANCIYAMANLKREYWLSDLRSRFTKMSRQERRAFIAASYFLGDEGAHWRKHTKEQLINFELLVRDWAADKITKNSNWKLPI